MPEESGGEKSLPASQIKRQKAREKGNVVKSQDLSSALALFAALGAMRVLGMPILRDMVTMARIYFGQPGSGYDNVGGAVDTGFNALFLLARLALPFMGFMLLAGVLACIFQVGFLFAPSAIAPKFEKINPIPGLARMFSVRSLFELVKSVLKLLLISYVVYLTLRNRWPEMLLLSQLAPLGIVKVMGDIAVLLWFRIALVMLALGLMDYGFQRWRYEEDLKMTTQEAREEAKQMEGDPRIKQRVRHIQRQMAMQRMMKDVPKADVVVTNPTTYAVALRYDMANMNAPTVIAKGARLLAQRIREIATENHVPVIEKPELARALFRTVEVGQPVPESLFRTVAEVLRFVYAIDRRADKVRERMRFLGPNYRGAGRKAQAPKRGTRPSGAGARGLDFGSRSPNLGAPI